MGALRVFGSLRAFGWVALGILCFTVDTLLDLGGSLQAGLELWEFLEACERLEGWVAC